MRSRSTCTIVAVGLAVTVSATSVEAQSATSRDSLATRIAYSAILSELIEFLARGAQDSTPTPWTIRFPSDTSGLAWSAIRDDLERLLRARQRLEEDSVRSHLTIGTVRYTPDSLVLEFDIGHYRRCPDRTKWIGSHSRFLFETSWGRLTWPPRPMMIGHGDAMWCDPRDLRRTPNPPPSRRE